MDVEKSVGLHIRYEGSLQGLIQKARDLSLPFFQCFLVHKGTSTLIHTTPDDIELFLLARRHYFTSLYMHASYWINLAGIEYTGHHALYRELHFAKKLEFTHIILHPGSAKGATSKMEGI